MTPGGPWREWWPALALAAVVVATAAAADALYLSWRYQSGAVRAGEWWRLLSANLVHLGWSHALLNVVGLLVVWALVGRRYSPAAWAALAVLTGLGTTAGLLLWNPDLGWYVGLSGVLHGLLTAGALAGLPSRPLESGLLLAVVAAKLAWEQVGGPGPGTVAMIDGAVIVDAHLYGALAGALAALPLRELDRRLARRWPGYRAG